MSLIKKVLLNNSPVELYKILKFESLVSSGGLAKKVIELGEVKVNNVIETRKRKKIVAGDVIEFNQQKIQVFIE